MIKLSTYMLLLGLILGIIAAIIIYFIAMDHNPQNVYTDHPEDLLFLLYGWISAVSLPFAITATIIQLIYLFRIRTK